MRVFVIASCFLLDVCVCVGGGGGGGATVKNIAIYSDVNVGL